MNQINIINKEYYDLNKDFLECKIHGDILVKPVLCQNADCEHIYCKQCVDQLPKSLNNNPYCPNCQESQGFTTVGTKNRMRMLNDLQLSCTKCGETHYYSNAVNCSWSFCKTSSQFYNEKRLHCCFTCWRCYKQFKTVQQQQVHVGECNPILDQDIINKQVQKSLSDMQDMISHINSKVTFVFNSLWTVLENKNLTDGFKNFNQEISQNKFTKFYSDVGFKNEDTYWIKTEQIRELDLKVFQTNESLEIMDFISCRKLGVLDLNATTECVRLSPYYFIKQQLDLKKGYNINKDEEASQLANWIDKMLLLIAKALPFHTVQKNPLIIYEIETYGTGTLEVLEGCIKKTSNDGWETMARMEKLLSEGVHQFKVRIDNSQNNKGIGIGFVNELNTDPSFSSNSKKFIGIYNSGSDSKLGLKRHFKQWQSKSGDVFDIKIDFNLGTIEFQKDGSIIADADVNNQGWSTLCFAIFIYRKGDSVSLLEYN